MTGNRSAPELSTNEFDQLATLFERFAGLQFSEASRIVFERRLGERVAALGLHTFSAYARYVSESSGGVELQLALDLVTTAETYFMRQEYQLRSFSDEVLPELAERKKAQRRLTIWSAGCSTGEEAYSLAALVHESGRFRHWEVRVVGTDVSTARLAWAREGRYRDRSFRGVGAEFGRAYFTREGQLWSVTPELRSYCHFLQVNLLKPEAASVLGMVDVAFCRNVLIYLSPRARTLVIQHLADRLTDGGYLFLGHSESLLNVESPLRPVHLSEDIAYRKPEYEATPSIRPRHEVWDT